MITREEIARMREELEQKRKELAPKRLPCGVHCNTLEEMVKMRSALVIPSAFETFPYAQQILKEASFRESEELIEFVEIMPTGKEICAEISAWFRAFLDGGANLSFEQASTCVTVDSGAHRDDVLGDVTLGAVLAGDHVLYTGRGREIGHLVPGTCFALCNKKLHGAKPREHNAKTKLVFATVDLTIDWHDLVNLLRAKSVS